MSTKKEKLLSQMSSPDVDIGFVRHPMARVHCRVFCGGESKTEQSHKTVVDINRMMSQAERHGVIPIDPRGRVPNYGDVSHLNLPFDELLKRTRDTNERIVKYTREEKEKLRLSRLEQRKQLEEKAAAYDTYLATVGKSNTTESQSS